jgi:hypothetical protein
MAQTGSLALGTALSTRQDPYRFDPLRWERFLGQEPDPFALDELTGCMTCTPVSPAGPGGFGRLLALPRLGHRIRGVSPGTSNAGEQGASRTSRGGSRS